MNLRFVKILVALCFTCPVLASAQEITSGQVWIAERAQVTFISRAPLDTIVATHSGARCELDAAGGKLRFVVPVADFQFRNALIQQHFSRYFLETDKFPNATFEGSILELNLPNVENGKETPVRVRGMMTLHGVRKELNATGNLKRDGKMIAASSTFLLNIADFGVKIPSLLRDNIAENVEISLNVLWTNHKG